MSVHTLPTLVALTGGSGAGKTWLAARLGEEFGDEAMTLSLDDYYRDRSHLSRAARERINYDHPSAIDWPLFRSALQALQQGLTVLAPGYDFVSHTRLAQRQLRAPRPVIIVEGLWLLRPAQIRWCFDLRIFLECPESWRWERRLARDLGQRGRTAEAVRAQFYNVVAPMHHHFVQTQRPWADQVLEQPISAGDFARLVHTIRALVACHQPGPTRNASFASHAPLIPSHPHPAHPTALPRTAALRIYENENAKSVY